MNNSEVNYQSWKVGITSNPDLVKGVSFKILECGSNSQATGTKKFFVDEKLMVNDNPIENNDETFIYVYR